MTLDGAKRAMKQQGSEKVSRNAELLEKLQSVRAMLIEVREILKTGEEGALLDEDLTEEEVIEEPEVAVEESEKPKKSAVKVLEPKQPRKRKKKDDDQRPLFAFYEQTLF